MTKKNVSIQWILLILLPFGVLQPPNWAKAELPERHLRSPSNKSLDEILRNYGTLIPGVTSAEIVTNNEAALDAKLHTIKSAGKGDNLDLSYYIFAIDHSTAHVSQELILAAQRGAKVRLLVDLHSNYSRFDWFTMLMSKGNELGRENGGSLDVRFYNRPNDKMMSDVSLIAPGSEAMWFSGFYSKNLQVIVAALQVGKQLTDLERKTQLNIQNFVEITQATPHHTENENSLGSTFQSIMPILSLDPNTKILKEFLPNIFFRRTQQGELSKYPQLVLEDHWAYSTDFNHQKLILKSDANGRSLMVSGGRNLENSYHMSPSHRLDFAQKLGKASQEEILSSYIFSDTDTFVQFQDDQGVIRQRFEQIWNFEEFVATASEVAAFAPVEYTKAFTAAHQICDEQNSTPTLKCIRQVLHKVDPALLDPKARLNDQEQRLKTMHNEFDELYMPHMMTLEKSRNIISSSQTFPTIQAIDSDSEFYYVENLNFGSDGKRTFGSRIGAEAQYGKNIHAVWLAAISETCKKGYDSGPNKLYLHNSYFFLPSQLTRSLVDAASGANACEHTQINIITNSMFTSDLSVINLHNDYMMKVVLDINSGAINSHRPAAQLKYFEYLPHNLSEFEEAGRKVPYSLHSKVAVFGTDIFVGSANADMRSLMMDANNGVYIRRAPMTVTNYLNWVQDLQADTSKTRDLTRQIQKTSLTQTRKAVIGHIAMSITSLGEGNLNKIAISTLSNLLKRNWDKVVTYAHSLVDPELVEAMDNPSIEYERQRTTPLTDQGYDYKFKLL
jgi:phosphatidylserine/phosphatidylglycerophosphate/cardiolipin synthase-like enzyme